MNKLKQWYNEVQRKYKVWVATRKLKSLCAATGLNVRWKFIYSGGSISFSAPVPTSDVEMAKLLQYVIRSLDGTIIKHATAYVDDTF